MSALPEAGTRIRLLAMLDDPNPLPAGSEGTVEGGVRFSDGELQIRVAWDSGRSLMLVVPPDVYEVLS